MVVVSRVSAAAVGDHETRFDEVTHVGRGLT
jgi:hypothetical protein